MKKPIRILYTNYRGDTGWRTIEPNNIWFGANQWHPDPQWLMDAIDLEKSEERTFAMKDIHKWEYPE